MGRGQHGGVKENGVRLSNSEIAGVKILINLCSKNRHEYKCAVDFDKSERMDLTIHTR